MNLKKNFIRKTKAAVENEAVKQKIEFAVSKYYQAQEKGKHYFEDFEAVRDEISALKKQTFDNFDFYFSQFKTNFQENGGKIFIARDSTEACETIEKIFREHGVKTVVKSKSMATEETEFNDYFEKLGYEIYETDLGEFIVQISGEKPFHIISPALHKSKQDVVKLYGEKFGLDKASDIHDITEFTRNFLRDKFFSAQAGITGANFLISDLGAIALTENEGNAFFSATFPDIHIIVAGIEKLIPSYKDLDLLWRVIAYRGTGQRLTVYNSVITPSANKPVYLILLDNGRFEIVKNEFDRQIFKCLRCGACFYHCPVYKAIGGHSYSSPYGGPMGSILSPLLFGLKDYGHLAFACTLCNKCVEVCPAKVPLTEMILDLRRRYVEKGYSSVFERLSMKMFAVLGRSRLMFNIAAWVKNVFLRPFAKILWGEKRFFPEFRKPFLKKNKINR